MASYSGPSSVQRAQLMRDAWHTFAGQSSTLAQKAFWFFSSYPPLAQGLYFLLLGLWPLLWPDGYQHLTGHTADARLLELIGALQLVVGVTLCLAAYRRQGSPEVLCLAFGSALARIAIDVHMIAGGESILYLFDVLVQAGLVAFWIYGWRMSTQVNAVVAVPRTVAPGQTVMAPAVAAPPVAPMSPTMPAAAGS